jgi:hypothetical protein
MRHALLALLLASPALAADLNPKTVAKIQREQNAAQEEIEKKHGNKKPSEMSSSERKEVIKETSAAQKEVLEKNKVDAKEFARYQAKMSQDDRAETAAAEKDLEAAAEKDKKAGAAKPAEIKVQKGFSDKNPVVLEAKEGAPPVVEHGLPTDGS